MGDEVANSSSSEEAMVDHVRRALVGQDLTTTSLGELRQELERSLGLPTGALDSQKERVQKLVVAEIARIQKIERQEAKAAKKSKQQERLQQSPEKLANRGKKRMRSSRFSVAAAVALDRKKLRRLEADLKSNTVLSTLTRADILDEQDVVCHIGGRSLRLTPKVSSSGGCSFYALERVTLPVKGKLVETQLVIQCAVLGSKDWEEGQTKTSVGDADAAGVADDAAADGNAPDRADASAIDIAHTTAAPSMPVQSSSDTTAILEAVEHSSLLPKAANEVDAEDKLAEPMNVEAA